MREACSLPRDLAAIDRAIPDLGDSDSLFTLADEHGVIAHLAAALGKASAGRVPHPLLESLRARHRAQLLFTLSMTAELFRILALFEASQIATAVVKGPVLSLRAYGDAAARQYVDLDLLVRHREIQRAAEALLSAGYQSRVPPAAIRAGKIPGEYLFRRPGTKIIFELHTEHTFRYFPRRLPIDDFFGRRTTLPLDGHVVPALSPEDEFVLISIHGAKHFWERLMWISDIAAMLHYHPALDWSRVKQTARDVGAERMVRVALLLANRVLRAGVPEPMAAELERDSDCAAMVDRIERWLPYGGYAAPAIAERALFRFRMRDSVLAGARYLAKLSFSTTEEDWDPADGKARSRLGEMLNRPLRLARKYRRRSGS